MITNTIQELFDRKSVRVFTDQEILPEEKELILKAAAAAPTAGNQQLYTILDITDQELKDKLAETCDHQPFIAKAPVLLLFVSDQKKWFDYYQLEGCKEFSEREPGLF